MRPILVNQDSVLVVEIVGVAGNVRTFVHHQHTFAKLRGDTFCNRCTRKTSTHD